MSVWKIIIFSTILLSLQSCVNKFSFEPSGINSIAPVVSAVAGDQKIKLKWNPVINPIGNYTFTVKRKGPSDSAPVVIASNLSALEYLDSGLTNGSSYTYSVFAMQINGTNNLESSSLVKEPKAPFVAYTTAVNSYVNIANKAAFTMSGTCFPSGQTIIFSNPAALSTTCTAEAWSLTADLSALGDANPFVISATIPDDFATVSSAETLNVIIDTAVPSVAITSPSNNGFINTTSNSATYTVSGTCSEASQSVVIKVDGSVSGSGATCDGTNFSASIDTTALSTGAHSLVAEFSDAAGNSTTSSTNNITKDLSGPGIAITAPANNSYINIASNSATFAVSGTCSEASQTVTIQIDGSTSGVGATCNGTTFSATVDTTGLSAGVRSFTALISDTSGNTATSAAMSVTKDVIAPTAAVSSPAVAAYISGSTAASFAVQGSCSEDTRSLGLSITDGTNTLTSSATCSTGSPNWSSTLNTSSLSDSSSSGIVLTVTHTDLAGNSTSTTRAFNKDTFSNPPVITSPTPTSEFRSTGSSITVAGNCVTGNTITLQGDATGTSVCASSQFSFSVSKGSVGTYTFTATQTDPYSNVSAASNTLTWVKTNAATKLNLTTAGSISINTCTAITLSALDASNTAASVSSNKDVSFSGAGLGGAFYQNNTCTTAITSLIMPIGTGAATFYFKTSKTDARTFTASASALTTATLTPTINPVVSATQIIFSLAPGYGFINQNFNPQPIVLIADANGNLVTSGPDATANVTLSLKAGSTGTLAGTYTVAAVNGVADFTGMGIKVDLRGDKVLTATKADLSGSGGTAALTVDSASFVIDALAYKLTYTTTPGSITAGSCNQFVVQVKDSNNQNTAVQSNTTLTFSSLGSGTVYSDAGCTTSITSTSIANGAQTASFYYKNNTRDEVVNLTTNASGLIAASASYTIQAASPSKLVIAGNTSTTQGSCESYTITTKNTSDVATNVSANLIVSLVGGGSGKYYSVAGCTSQIMSTMIASGSNNVTVYYKNLNAQTVTLGANATALDATTLSVTIGTAAIGSFAISGPTTVTTSCSGPWTVTSKDSSGSTVVVGSNTTVKLGVSGQGTFYTDSTCATSTSTAVIAAATSSNTFYFRGDGDEAVLMSVSDPSAVLGGSSLLVTVTTVIVSSSSSYDTHCSVTSSGRLYCVGNNTSYGLLGIGSTANANYTTPVLVATGVSKVDMGNSHGCALFSNGIVKCWGYNGNNNLGNGNSTNQSSPVAVSGITNAVDIAVSYYGGCAVLSTGTINCWGYGGNGQLGNGSYTSSSTPVSVSSITTGTKVVGSERGYCALLSSGGVKCWGYIEWGLGNGSSGSGSPVDVSGLTSGVASLAASYSSVCARLTSGSIKCWGQGDSGQMGNNSTSNYNYSPVSVTGITTATDINADISTSQHFCARLSDSTVKCWGYAGSYRVLGVAQGSTNALTPITPTGFSGSVASIGAQNNLINCLLMADGSEKCIGHNANGQLGDGTTTTPTASFVTVKFNFRNLDVFGVSSLTKQTCSAYTIRNLVDGVAQTFPSDTTVNLSSTLLTGTGAISYHDDAACSGGAITSKAILAGETSKTVYLKSSNGPATFKLVATATGFGASANALAITGTPAKFKLITTLSTVGVGQCVQVNVGIYDTTATQSVPLTSNLTLNLLATNLINENHGSFHTDSNCLTTPVSSLTLGSGLDSGVLYYKNSNYEYITITAVDQVASLTSAASATIDFGGVNNWSEYLPGNTGYFLVTGLCTRLKFNPTSRTVDMLWGKDSFVVNGVNQNIYSDQNCTTTTTTFNLSKDSASYLYIKSSTDSVTWWADYLATSSVYGTAANNYATMSANVLDAFPAGWNYSVNADSCVSISLLPNFQGSSYQSLLGAINLDYSTNSGAGQFYSDADCSQSIASGFSGFYYDNNYGANAGKIYYKDSNTGSPTLSFKKGAVTYATLSLTVNSPSTQPFKLAISGPASETSGVCSGAFTVQVQNRSSTATNTNFDLNISLGGQGSGQFYYDSGCTSQTSSITVYDTTSSQQFWFKGVQAESLTLTASNTFLQNASVGFSVTAGTNPNHLAWTGPSIANAGVCTALTVETHNASNAIANVAATETINFSEVGFGKFYSNPGCTTVITSTTISANTNFKTIYYKNDVAQSLNLVASGNTLSQATKELSIISPSGYSIALSGPSQGNLESCVGPYTAQALDASLAPYLVPSGQTLSLTGLSTLTFYTTSDCSVSTTTRTIVTGQSSVQFYVKDVNAQKTSMLVLNTTSSDWSGGALDFVSNPLQMTNIKISSNFGCAIFSGGALKCWGYNGTGQLGIGSTTNKDTPTQVTGLSSGVVDFALGPNHACALLNTGGVKCWGYNAQSQLGDGSTTQRTGPVDVVGLTSGVSQIALGYSSYHSCAILNSGEVKCWGYNGNGQLGDGTTVSRTSPVSTGLLSGVSKVTVGGSNTCAVMTTGDLKCWGSSSSYMFTSAVTSNVTAPMDIALTVGDKASAVSMGYSSRCLVLQSGGVKCWGNNGNYELGTGNNNSNYGFFTPSGLVSGVSKVQIGSNSSCATLQNGEMKCWGYNYYGQVGNGSTLSAKTPVTVLSDVSNFSVVSNSVCALDNNSALKCWGYNSYNNIGRGDSSGTYDHMLSPTLASQYSRRLTLSLGTSPGLNVCMPIYVQSQLNGSNTTFHQSEALSLSTTASDLIFYSDSSCSNSVTSVNATAGSSSVTFYAKASNYFSLKKITVAAPYYNSGIMDNVTVGNTASYIAFLEGNYMPNTGVCTALAFQLVDSNNIPAKPYDEDSSVTLSINNSNTWSEGIYSDPDCNSSASSITLPAGKTKFVFYFKSSSEGLSGIYLYENTHGLSLYSNTGYSTPWGSGFGMLTRGEVHNISKWITAPSHVHYGSCVPVTLDFSSAISYDAYFYANSGGLNFFNDPSCTNWNNTFYVPAFSTQATLYVKASWDTNDYIYAYYGNDSSLQVYSSNFDIGWNNTYVTLTEGSDPGDGCIPVTIDMFDGSNNIRNASGDVYFNLSTTGSGLFYSDPGCSSSTSNAYISGGASSGTFYIQGASSGDGISVYDTYNSNLGNSYTRP